jgi:hypothetical protein
MQALKALVIGMGILIIAGMAILVYGLTSQFGSTVAGKDQAQAFGTIRATLPAGATVENVQMQDGSVLVFLSMPDGGVQLMVFRLSDGRQTGTIELQPAR